MISMKSETLITIVFDNYAWLEGFKTLWEFFLFAEALEFTFLFDTGSNERFFLTPIWMVYRFFAGCTRQKCSHIADYKTQMAFCP